MLFCCFRNKNVAEGSQDAVPAKSSELQREGAVVENDALGPITASQANVQSSQSTASYAGEQRQRTASESSPQAKGQHPSQDAVMKVVSILQELLGLTSERMQVSRIMALLCQRLSVSWACLTALSADGEIFHHIGSAYVVEMKLGTSSFSSCRAISGIPQSSGLGRGPPSRTSSTSSMAGASTVEVGMSDPHLLRGSETSIEVATSSNQPLLLSDLGTTIALGSSIHGSPSGALPDGQQQQQQQQQQSLQQPSWSSSGAGADVVPQPHPSTFPPSSPHLNAHTHPNATPHSHNSQQQQQRQQQSLKAEDGRTSTGKDLPVTSWPIDWQLMHRERGIRAFACLPVSATNGSGTIIGCLSLGSTEPLDWSQQFWVGSARLITGWAASAITTTRATARATFYSRLFCATNLDGLARAFVYDMPVFLADGAAGPGTALPEVRLALVSSRLQHAVVYAAPLLQVSGRLSLGPNVHQMGLAGGGGGPFGNGVLGHGGGIGGGGGPLVAFGGSSGPSGSGVSMAGLVLGSANSLGTDRGLVVGGPPGAAPPAYPALAGRGAPTATGYDTMDCMVLGTTLDVEEQMSGCSSSNSAGGAGGAGGGGGGASSARRGGGNHSSTGNGGGDGAKGMSPPSGQEPPPVDCVKISTDSTLLMSVLEAGDIMIIKDALHYFGGGRMIARDLALNNTRPATAGTLVILPLVHRCRSLGCVYVFARNEFNLTFSRGAWGDMAAMLSRAVFGQLVGKLRHEWYAVLSEDPESHAAHFQRSRSITGGMGAVGGHSRVRRTTTGNSLCSNASSLRPSFEMPSRSVEQGGGPGGSVANKEVAAALAAAAAVLEYAGFMLPDGDDGQAAAAAPAAVLTVPRSQSPGATTVSSSSPRHRIPAEHAGTGSFYGGSGGSGGGTGSSEPPFATGLQTTDTAAGASHTAVGVKMGGSDPPSISPGSLSFRLPQGVQEHYREATGRLEMAEAAAVGISVREPRTESRRKVLVAKSENPPPPPQQQQQQQQQADQQGGKAKAEAGEAEAGEATCGLPLQGTPETLGVVQAPHAGGGGASGAATVVATAVAVTAATATAEPMTGITEGVEEDGDVGEEISGSSRELQGWPELVDILHDMHRTRNVSVYLAAYRGQVVAVKMMRSHLSVDGRPGHLESEAVTIAAQQQLSTLRHPNVLRVLMVYPLVYEVVAGKAQRGNAVTHGAVGAGGGGGGGGGVGTSANCAGHGHGQNPPQNQPQQQQQQVMLQQHYGLGRGPLNMMAHAMSDLMSGAGAADASGVGVYLTAVLPRREKFKCGLALMLELFPSLSLREAMQKRMLVALPDAVIGGGGAGGLACGEQLGTAVTYTYVNSQTTTVSEGHPGTPTMGHMSSGVAGGLGAVTTGGGGHLPPYLPPLPEVAGGNDPAFNAESSPGLAITGTSNSGGAIAGGFSSGPGGGQTSPGAPPMQLLLAILSQVVAGMAALHSAGLAHGELRPENVLLALPQGGTSHTNSGQHERIAAVDCATMTPRTSPTPPPRSASGGIPGGMMLTGGSGVSGGGVGGGGGGGRFRSAGGWVSSASGGGCVGEPERPQPGRPITTDVMVKIKDAGMTVVGFSKGNQTVRKLLQRNRSAILPFLPPEVHRGERFGRSADVYMFGILMWELYTGGVAFSNLTGTPIKLLQTIIADGVRPPWPEGTPAWYQSLASRCWAGNPKQRPSFRRIGDKLAEASSAAAAASVAAVAGPGWAGGGGGGGGGGGVLHGVAEGL